jgi:ADP-ribose pyrophosphatase
MELEWRKIKEEKFKVSPHRRMLKKTFILPDGVEATYDLLDVGKTSSVLGFTPENNVILTKIFRPGPEKVLVEIPGGWVEEGEDPEKAAERELLEETGYRGDLEFVGTSIDDAYSNCIRYIYVAKNCQRIKEVNREFDEFMDVIEMPLKDFRTHLRSGELTDTELGYLALDYLDLL